MLRVVHARVLVKEAGHWLDNLLYIVRGKREVVYPKQACRRLYASVAPERG